MPLLEHKGTAVDTCRLNTLINASATSADLDTTPTNWPTGGANGKFYVTFNKDESNEETWLCNARSGNTISVTSVADRGKDGTVATTHNPGEPVVCTFPAEEAHDYNQHLYVTTRDDHTQYMKADGTRHDLAARHTFTALGWAPGTPVAVVANAAASVGTGAHPAHSDHGHAGPVTASPVAVGTALSAGSGTALALANHVHDLAAGVIDTSNFFTAGVVDSAALGALSVIAGKLANGAINNTSIIADAMVLLTKLALEDPTNYNPTAASFSSAANLTVGGSGATYGYWFKAGRLAVGWCGYRMDAASGGNLPAGSSIRIPVPFTQRTLGVMRGFVAARARRSSDGFVASGTGVIQAGNTYGENVATAGSAAEWDATTPFNWGTPGDGDAQLDAIFFGVSNT